MSATLRRTIFAACRELGLDGDARHDLQLRVTGKTSLSDMDARELRLVVSEMKRMGFRLSRGPRKRAPRGDLRFAHVLWRLLNEAGVVKVPGAKGLNAFIRARFEAKWGHLPIDIDAMRDADQINDVVEALKAWCVREGIELER
ncbi:regulatory protein GemA [Maritimibacter sp. HL-12]|uniref:regulatory protein GemA n=1 Tax=Maritimibacter sp. HL-12 TaxID=1162418 RepID=UPI000A0F20F9|nr:regulatory protein GemA [Maritimibacter sp. HL-12]SMH35980.1 Mu-like prophage protein gp16 [Maritimibacter sp. HL-12]